MTAMKHAIHVRHPRRRITSIVFAALLLSPGLALAAECPETSPDDPQERRKLAKEWFSRGETAENDSNDADATRAYACSYKMVAHPYTAYNLARVAERANDSELALKMYKAYLTLKPDAQEREQVKAKIKDLEDKIAANPSNPLSDGVAAAVGSAAPLADGTTPADGTEGATATTEPVTPPPAEPEEVKPPPRTERPSVQARRQPAAEEEDETGPSRLPEYLIGGVTVAALVGGLITNLSARSKMSSCDTNATNGLLKSAQNDCDAAKPLAYASYALFGVAVAGIAVDTALFILRRSDKSDDSSVGFMLLPGGGGALTARGRF
jgi:hypothetical protein